MQERQNKEVRNDLFISAICSLVSVNILFILCDKEPPCIEKCEKSEEYPEKSIRALLSWFSSTLIKCCISRIKCFFFDCCGCIWFCTTTYIKCCISRIKWCWITTCSTCRSTTCSWGCWGFRSRSWGWCRCWSLCIFWSRFWISRGLWSWCRVVLWCRSFCWGLWSWSWWSLWFRSWRRSRS